MTTSVSEYKTRPGGGGGENIFKTAAGKNMRGLHEQKYGHTQETTAEKNAIRNLIPKFMIIVLNLVFLVYI